MNNRILRAILLMFAVSVSLLSCSGKVVGGDGEPETDPTYHVYYDGNGSTGGDVPVDQAEYVEGAAAVVLGNSGNLEKSGFSFSGWNSSADGTGASYSQGASLEIGSEDVTLYAQWTTLPTFSVTYDGNGYTGDALPVDQTNYLTGAWVTVASVSESFTLSGYTFAGWNDAADGSGESYPQGATFQMGTASVILYAQWTKNPTYTITYDANGATGGTVPVDSSEYEAGAQATVMENTGALVKAAYLFDSWNTAADGSGTSLKPGDLYTVGSANCTLYAQWVVAPLYSIAYCGNGYTSGTAPVCTEQYYEGQSVTLALNSGSLVKTETISAGTITYYLIGWNTAADGSGSRFSLGAVMSMPGNNTVLYAEWSIIGGTGPAGGFIFYDKGAYSDSWRYMEAAPVDQTTSTTGVVWLPDCGGYINSSVGVTISGAVSSEIGAGKSNTAAIISFLKNYATGTYAALVANSYTVNGYKDWFLPSRYEAKAMMINLKAVGMGNFLTAYYWSSTSYDDFHAYGIVSTNGADVTPSKYLSTPRVRAVRYF